LSPAKKYYGGLIISPPKSPFLAPYKLEDNDSRPERGQYGGYRYGMFVKDAGCCWQKTESEFVFNYRFGYCTVAVKAGRKEWIGLVQLFFNLFDNLIFGVEITAGNLPDNQYDRRKNYRGEHCFFCDSIHLKTPLIVF